MGNKNSHEIIYTRYSSHTPPPQCLTPPPQPHVLAVGRGGGGGARGVGGVGWGIGGVGYEKNIVYISIHTHMLVPGLRWGKNKKLSNSSSYPTILNNSTGKMNQNSARSCLDRSQADISQFLSSDYGDPIINRTVPTDLLR